MSLRTLYYVFLIIVVLGLADTIYLSMTVLLDVAPVCGPLHGCETVAASKYSRLLGIPLAYLGVAYYLFGAGITSFLERSHRARVLALVYALIGTAMSVWFIYIQAVLIKALCMYCLTSAAAAFALAIVAFLLLTKGNQTENLVV
jgi:uncharacterized membrane protein